MKTRFEIEWCDCVEKDEDGYDDMSRALYLVDYFATEKEAIDAAIRKNPECYLRSVRVTEQQQVRLGRRMCWEDVRYTRVECFRNVIEAGEWVSCECMEAK